jgi:hypothetical protein
VNGEFAYSRNNKSISNRETKKMPTLSTSLPLARWPLAGLTRAVSWLGEVMDLFAEVDRLVWEARARYPMAD